MIEKLEVKREQDKFVLTKKLNFKFHSKRNGVPNTSLLTESHIEYTGLNMDQFNSIIKSNKGNLKYEYATTGKGFKALFDEELDATKALKTLKTIHSNPFLIIH